MKKKNLYYLDDKFIEGNLSAQLNIEKVDPITIKRKIKAFKKTNSTFFIRGILRKKFCDLFIENNINFFYIDTGYFGNFNRYYSRNPEETETWEKSKIFHRIVFNSMQTEYIRNKSGSRYKSILKFINKEYNMRESDFLMPWKKSGKKILICPPSGKTCHAFGVNTSEWIDNTINSLKQYTNKEIIIRTKPNRRDRINSDMIQEVLDDDIFILVTYNSIAATEAIIHGVPALTLGLNAASPVSINKIKNIENPIYPDRKIWLNNLSYEQFHITEINNGIAWEFLKSNL